MSSAIDALRTTLARAGSVLLLIHTLAALAALALTSPLRDSLARELSAHGSGLAPTPADVAQLVELVARHGLPVLRSAWPALLAFTLLSPALTVALAHALASGTGLPAALRVGASRVLAAAAVRVFAILLFVSGGGVLTVSFAFVLGQSPELLELPLQLGYLLLLALHALGCATFHDLALARLALRRTRLSRALMAALLRTTPRIMAWRGAAGVVALALTILADLSSRGTWPLPDALAPVFGTALAQTLLFAALISRALFLLHVVRPVPNVQRSLFSTVPDEPTAVSLPPP